MATHECYISMLKMGDYLQALSIEERRVVVEPTKDQEEISLDDDVLDRVTRIGTQTNTSIRKELALFPKNNRDIFA